MLTRGHYIGKIVDDLASLKYQIATRNKLGQFDLSKFCEDFFREVLNITYGYKLSNLNKTKSNFPGLDLGDETVGKIAFQITSQKTSEKMNATLKALTTEHTTKYNTFKVLIVGERQTSYTLDKKLSAKYNFDAGSSILDINSLLRDIVLLDIDKLSMLFTLFQVEFRQLKIELEPVDVKGNFESSYFNSVELKPATPPKNARKYFGKGKDSADELKKLIKLYNKLASVPRVTREILFFIADRGKYDNFSFRGKFHIMPQILEKILRVSQNELLTEINILENEELVVVDMGHVGERKVPFLYISNTRLNELFLWAIDENISIRTLLNTMDFTLLDE